MRDGALPIACALAACAASLSSCGARTDVELGIAGLRDGGVDGTLADARGGGGRDGGDARSDESADQGVPDSIVPLCRALDAGGDAGPCTGIACNVASCSKGADTTVSGFVYAPNGLIPLYDALVYVPNAPLEPLARGVQCASCGADVSGEPITATHSSPTGAFTLRGVPAGADVPLVVQLGKWRRRTTLSTVRACVDNPLTDPSLTRLPRNQGEGDMPHIALTTGACDQIGCMLPKIGIDVSEFGAQGDGFGKAVNVYNGSGGAAALGATTADKLWGDEATLFTYDQAIFSCECMEHLENKGGTYNAPPFGVVTKYLDAGGRVFTTDFQYTWYKYSPDPNLGGGSITDPIVGIGEIIGNAPAGGSPMTLDQTNPKVVPLATWLANIFSGTPLPSGATFMYDPYAATGKVNPDVMFSNVQRLDPTKTVTWATSPNPEGPRIFSVSTPVGAPASQQCGRGLHIDAHVDDASQAVGPGYPRSGCSSSLKADEAAFAFFFFALSSCSESCE